MTDGEAATRVDLAFDARTDTGLVRAANEDSMIAERPVFLVADGVGGHAAGEVASGAVVAAFRDHLCSGAPATLTGVRAALREAEERVRAIPARTQRNAGSTVSGVVLVEYQGETHWLILNVGDSRVYRQLGADLEQLTVDHSLVQEMVDDGRIMGKDRRSFAQRNVITRAIGAEDARADSWIMPVTTGERLLICSDGLHGEVPDEDIRAILTMTGRPAAATSALVDAAKRAGGRDNITVVVVDVRAGGRTPGASLDLSTTSRALGVDAGHDGETSDTVGDTVPV